MGFPTDPAQSYSNPTFNGIPGIPGYAISSLDATTLSNKPAKASSPEDGEITDGIRIDEARIVAMEAKMEKLEKDNEALRNLVAHLCRGVANINRGLPKPAQPETSDAVLEKMASDMSATVLDGFDKPMPKNPDTPMSDQLSEDTTGGAEPGPPLTPVQYLTKKQEKVTKDLLAILKRMTNLETSFESHQTSNAKGRTVLQDEYDFQKKTTEDIRGDIKDLKRKLEVMVEGYDRVRRNDLHQRIKMNMQMRSSRENYTLLWDKLVQCAAISGTGILNQVADAQRKAQRGHGDINFIASKLYNAALTGPLPAQIGHLQQVRRDLHSMEDGRALTGPNNSRIFLSREDISMLNTITDQVEDMFKDLKKANPRWDAESKAHESRQANYGNDNGIGAGVPSGPKRAREEEDERERERERLDRELERGCDDRRDTWAPRYQPFDRAREFDRQRNFGNQGYGARLDNPKRRR